jgi:hypothetical protein
VMIVFSTYHHYSRGFQWLYLLKQVMWMSTSVSTCPVWVWSCWDFYFSVLGFELSVLYCSTTWTMPPALAEVFSIRLIPLSSFTKGWAYSSLWKVPSHKLQAGLREHTAKEELARWGGLDLKSLHFLSSQKP